MKLKLVLAFLALWSMACNQPKEYVRVSGPTQGTMYNITYFDPQGRQLRDAIDSVLQHFDNSLSTYNPNSLISAINRGETRETDLFFRTVFAESDRVSRETGGAFDATVAPLVNAWGFGFKNKENITSGLIDSLLQHVGYWKARIADDKLLLDDSLLMFDFNAIAQGYSVDVVADYLRSLGIENYLVEIGGEIAAKGVNPKGELWSVGIDKPTDNAMPGADLQAVLSFTDKALATSGNYRKFYVRDGVKYAHTIDPKTGYPVQHSLLSATVIAPKGMTADAFATAFMVIGADSAKLLLAKEPELDAYFILGGKDGEMEVWMTDGMKSMLRKE